MLSRLALTLALILPQGPPAAGQAPTAPAVDAPPAYGPSLQAPHPVDGPAYAAPCESCEEGVCWTHAQPGLVQMLCDDLCDFVGRSSATHGRATGYGGPLRGSSWLNRPFEVTMEFGALLMANEPSPGVRSSNDLFAALQAGWDWDHYWGSQCRVGWSTPRLDNTQNTDDGSDNLFIVDASLLYYPWGDSRLRPYWRVGMGLTDIEFTNRGGVRQHEFLYTLPIGLGLKHRITRSIVWRAEIVDNLAFGLNDADTMNNLTLTLGLEGRFGGHPSGYWAWRPRGYAW